MPLLTMVFTDVVESSATKRDVSFGRDSRERDHAYLEKVQGPHFTLVRQCCQAHGGTEVSTMGDAFYLTFEDPMEAVRCAVEIQKRLADGPINTPRGPLRLRIGIHSGFPEHFEGSWHGTDVDTAARVESVASAQQILLSSRTYELVHHMNDVQFHPCGEFALKGVGRITLWEADWAGSGPRPTAVSPLASANRNQAARKKLWIIGVPVACLLVAALIAGALYRRSHQTKPLTDRDTIVLADFANSTGDAVFDGTLRQGLAVQLEQSPFLNILADQKVRDGLKLMGRSSNDRLTADLARELCQREGGKALIAGSIASLGSQYVIGLDALNCQTGDSLAREQATAQTKERVLDALDKATATLRQALGESLSSVRKFDRPLAEATTPSLEALEAFSLGTSVRQVNDSTALPFLKRAVELDPQFASAYEALGVCYLNLGEVGLSREYLTRAFDLRDRASEREKFVVEARYYAYATGDLHKAVDTYQLWVQTYPRSASAHANLATLYGGMGQYEKAVPESLEAIRLEPDAGSIYSNLIVSYAALDRFDDAQKIHNLAISRKALDPILNVNWFGVSFVLGDRAEMDRLIAASAGQPEAEDNFLAAKSDTEAFFGHLNQAREFSRQAVASAVRSDQKETAAQWKLDEVITEAEFGNPEIARRDADLALAWSSNHDSQILAALAFARTGDSARAQTLANDLAKRYPLDTLVNEYWLPVIRAAIEIAHSNPGKALQFTEVAIPFELASPQTWSGLGGPLYPAYLRGQAFLMLGHGADAAMEYRKLVDHRGYMMACPLGPLARLGLARAYALQRDTGASRSAYQDFLTLWKSADSDIPILRQAKAEYAKLQ